MKPRIIWTVTIVVLVKKRVEQKRFHPDLASQDNRKNYVLLVKDVHKSSKAR